MNAKELLASLQEKLVCYDENTRKEALLQFKEEFASTPEAAAPEIQDNNMHCHTSFSFNGYGFSPSYIACWAKAERLFAVGKIEFDVLDGADEFLEASRLLSLRAACGVESRVVIQDMIDKVINSPGEPGIAYHLGVGFPSASIPAAQAEFLSNMKKAAADRTRGIVQRVNPVLSPVELDFDKDVLTLTPAGNATERHVCAAYEQKAVKMFSDPVKLAEFWSSKLNVSGEEASKLIRDSVKLQGVIRSKMMKSGGPGYVKPDPSSFPSLGEMNRFTLACGAIPGIAWLDGTSAGESDPDILLDMHESHGAALFNLIPDRNWNFPDPEVKAKKVAHMNRIIDSCVRRNMPVFVGTEMNAAGQKLVDTFSEPALAGYMKVFVEGAAILNAHTILAPRGKGFLSDWAKEKFGNDKKARNQYYAEFGAKNYPA
ncbi:MAG: hypothetical protein BWY31_01139 [Lentisphaerae bacterium ADurb.Bin242]|nr:MAG: hypothetical protein BWY31_01139 [Lentisphaerae bacterium ADurb.Bin242]